MHGNLNKKSRRMFLRMRNISGKRCREIFFFIYSVTFYPKIVPFMRQCRKILYSRTGHTWQYCACAFHAE